MSQFNLFVLAFFSYAFAGQIWEIMLNKLQFGRWRYSGFLHLPIVPLYGFSALMMVLVAQFLPRDPLMIFIFSCVAITFLEYFTSLILEKLFHRRWWDYRDTSIEIVKRYQFEGRISLPVSLVWGILSLLVVYLLQPHIAHLAQASLARLGLWPCLVLLGLFAIDLVISIVLASRGRRQLSQKIMSRKDENANSRH